MQLIWALLKNVPLVTRRLNTTVSSSCATFFFSNPYDSAKYFDRKAHCLALFPPRGQFQKSLAIAERVIKTKQTTDWVYLCSFPSCSLSVVLKYCKSSVANKVNLKKNKNRMSIKGKTYLFYI